VSAPTVVKIDVEGGEMAVLKGLAETLASVCLVYVECHGDSGRIREFLRERGFELETIDVDGHQLMIRAERSC
jgi:hypothetical protein